MDYQKLSPLLSATLDDFQEGGRPALAGRVNTLGVVSAEPSQKAPRVVVFVHPRKGADLGHLEGPGIELNAGEGPIRTGIVHLEALDALTEDPAVARVVPARRLKLLMNVASEKVGLPAFRQATNLTGKGVVIGTVDTGIETDHPAFAGRILRVWDQTLHGKGVPEGKYGVELMPPMIDITQDTVGHGTHVAGIASGVDPTYGGVAQGAELVIVKSDLLTAHIADGVRYIFRVAAEMGRPAVVNLSLGGHGDAHDGTDSLSLVIDSVIGPGRIVCCAAGNEGDDNIHSQVRVAAGKTRTVAAAVPRPAANEQPFTAAFNGWYDGKDRMTVSVVSPSRQATPPQAIITGDNPAKTYKLDDGVVRVTTPGPDPANGDINFIVEIQPAPAPPPPPPGQPQPRQGPWRIRVGGEKITGEGIVDVWTIDESVALLTGGSVIDNMKVGSPGCATSAITVASYTTRSEWEDMFGNSHDAGMDVDTMTDFSSEGPRRDGAKKPEVAAPGAMIGAALSAQSGVGPAVMLDDLNRINAGTSMACPFIAGMVALLLERDPTLDPKGAKKLLQKRSRIPGERANHWDPKWGYGFLTAKGL